jgi:transposase-like protein
VAHARAKLTVLGRQLLVDRVVVDGWKPADAAKAMGVSRQTAYKWLRRFHDQGVWSAAPILIPARARCRLDRSSGGIERSVRCGS